MNTHLFDKYISRLLSPLSVSRLTHLKQHSCVVYQTARSSKNLFNFFNSRNPWFFNTYFQGQYANRLAAPSLYQISYPRVNHKQFSLSLRLYSHLDLGHFLSFLILHTVGRTPWRGDQPIAKAATYI
jgi:hypothetical protein